MFLGLNECCKPFYQLTTIMPFSLALTNFRKEYKAQSGPSCITCRIQRNQVDIF